MKCDRHRKAKEIFLATCDLALDQRSSYLDRACAGEADLRLEVEALLDAGDDVGIHHPKRLGPPISPVSRLATSSVRMLPASSPRQKPSNCFSVARIGAPSSRASIGSAA